MKVSSELKALHEALTLFSSLERLDKSYSEWKVWKDRDIQQLDDHQIRKFWAVKLSFIKAKKHLEKRIQNFVRKYKVLPISRDGNKIICEFNGKSVRGYKTFIPLYENLIDLIELPKSPRILSEVFG